MKRSVSLAVLVAVLALVSAAPSGAAARKLPRQHARTHPAPMAIYKTFSSTYGPGTIVRVSTNGNVVGFASPTDVDHIDAGDVVEGYVLCYKNPNTQQGVNAYDVNLTASGFGPATDAQAGTKVTRKTSDGLLELTQTYTFNGKSRSLQISQTLQNVSGVTITNIGLRRQVDFDIDAGGTDGTADFNDIFGATSASVFAYRDTGGSQVFVPPGDHGLMLRSLLAKFGKQSGLLAGFATTSYADTGCIPSADATPTSPTDDGASVASLPVVTLKPAQKLVEVVEYDAF